ncbi:hypothetical protein COCC4DRAFT_129983 [Bipolaris maydis ATCC 48331]|uniref:Uncharacterized protein n=2 Tax=Cochliobolus heterostrophus TaxID=5016 RepID=M2UWN5_COCH5|nr:uncharacterized protein COCC4DRAFT_129983 [Bipolaris maydis ATCC 48331]EMD92233.1 hypothetical protein COCHEDRAFT_1100830 [Bipolaris maydis C5]KAJ5022089.1 hypothetical protein J3E73DRAFT_197382 [Bipolaris maydis]ENI07927.1 hypothetical protein COCC4DRAFT_129983 [Bipolaris maydis ATCC 48331]KAJ6210036.1 hypothetical protein PSV09DRAFT_1100830 [Bipolaris maydis]KAJ6272412.1 hypothetical protein PSV08DRAFT_370417 [Bipolaris maydis]
MITRQQNFDYTTTVSKGRTLITLMRTTDDEASLLQTAQSAFLSPSALSQSGYERTRFTLTPSSPLYDLQKSLGIDPSTNTAIGHSHLESGVRDGAYVPATWAKFNTVINAAAGMLVAVDNESPTQILLREGAGRDGGKSRQSATLPELKYWSDVVFLQWQIVTGGNANLQFVVRLGITNGATLDVLQHVLRKGGVVVEEGVVVKGRDVVWTVREDEEAVAAILGTPNGSGVARLLLHHKRELGHKVVEEVRLVEWKGEGVGEPSLVFRIGNLYREGDGGSQETVRGGSSV